MKKFALALLLAIPIFCFSQSKKKSLPQKDTTHQVQAGLPIQAINDSTGILSVIDLNGLYQDILQELPAKYSNKIQDWIQQRIAAKITKYNAQIEAARAAAAKPPAKKE